MRRFAALVAVAAAVVAVPGGLVGGTAACADENAFAIVVDFGDAPGAPSGKTVTCVPVDDDDTAADALAARARTLGRPAPRYNNAGLLCSLDGFPESGCGERTTAGYRYWSYWFGGDSWTYASTGPAFHRAKPGGVVGWRFQPTGTATASDPPPRASARFADLCRPSTAATSSPATTAPRTSPTSAPALASTPPSTNPSMPAEPTSTTSLPSTSGASSTTSITERVSEGDGSDGEDQVAIVEEGGDGGGSSWPLAVGGIGVAAAIGGAAAMKARRR